MSSISCISWTLPRMRHPKAPATTSATRATSAMIPPMIAAVDVLVKLPPLPVFASDGLRFPPPACSATPDELHPLAVVMMAATVGHAVVQTGQGIVGLPKRVDPDIVDELVLVVGEFVLEVVVVLGDSVVTIMEVNSIVVNSKSLPRILYRSLWIGRNISAREKFRLGKCHRTKMFLLPNTSRRKRHWLAMSIRRTILLQTCPNETHDAGIPLAVMGIAVATSSKQASATSATYRTSLLCKALSNLQTSDETQ